VIDLAGLGRLIAALQSRGYEVLGPQIRDGAVVYDTLEKPEDLPAGWGDEQAPGRYRLKRNGSSAVFGYTVGPHSWKRFLHPPQVRLTQIQREGQDLRILGDADGPPAPKYAFLGVRACELAAIAIQDRVLAGDKYKDPAYGARRHGAFLIVAQCTSASANCFCTSMNTGPKAAGGYDLALTELAEDEGHCFVVEAGTETGAEVLAELQATKAGADMVRRAEAAVEAAADAITRRLDTTGIRDLLYQAFEHPRWDDVSARCLNCGNCTLVCPTCFCSTVEDSSDVGGTQAERWRRWDSCFVQSFSYIHGGSVRMSSRSRYRQWLTHKLGAWIDQFGTSGCVGCGRCITWCPVGIDITQEVAAIRGGAPAAGGEQADA
jgi:ferredoxin